MEHTRQVLGTREVLDHRVDDDHVESLVRERREVVRSLGQQRDVCRRAESGKLPLDMM